MKKISRRSFLEQATYASSTFGIMLSPLPGMASRLAVLPGKDTPQFGRPEIIHYDAQCFTIHGRDTFLYSACMHYPRTPKALWRDRLVKLKRAGFNTIETYVFWNYHEPVEGNVDMSEFADFLKLIHELGLWSIARVGPYVCAEWDAGGFPHWLIEKQFPLRSDSPESIRTSKNWYGHVLPVVRENMITRGGPVILVQIENEYDFWKLPNANKLKYMTALAETAWKAGIDVPLITNWCQQARENNDPVMARIMDTCDFYPRWNVVKGTVPELKKLRQEEPTSPVSIAELQGGWFSKFGGKLSVDQVGINAAQLNMLAKTVIEHGTTYLSFYMGHGGTNFDWAARMLTTSYDYAAPIREPGGLWDKYYAARLIGAFLNDHAPMILRAKNLTSGASSSNEHVSASLLVHSGSGIVFVRENADADQSYRLKILDPANPTAAQWDVPRHGSLTIEPRGMKMLTVNLLAGKTRILYSTAEILAQGVSGDRDYVVIYDHPGSLVEIAIRSPHKPEVSGNTRYVEFDQDRQAAVIGFPMDAGWKSLLVEDGLQIIALPRKLAGTTWTAPLPSALSGHGSTMSPVISDCALISESSAGKLHTKLALEYQSGSHVLTILAPQAPRQCTVDGKDVQMEHDPHLGATTIHLETPRPNPQAVVVTNGEFWVDRFDPSIGNWQSTEPVALEKLGQIPYGYVKYRASVEYHGEEGLAIETFTKQNKQVFLNGRHIAALSGESESLFGPLAGQAKPGKNLLEISYEAFGGANFGKDIQDLTGIRSIRLGSRGSGKAIGKVELERFSAAAVGHDLNPKYAAGGWQPASLVSGETDSSLAPAFTWFRAEFSLNHQPLWFLPRKLVLDSSHDALLYVNGKFVGNYQTVGPQSEFYLPEPYLYEDGRKNTVTVLLAYTANPRAIRKLVIEPYKEFAARRTDVQFSW